MANANSPFGLRPVSYVWGSPYANAYRTYYVPASNGTALYVGDPVITLDNSADANGVPAVGIATAGAGNYVTGAIIGLTNNAGELVIPVLQSSTVYLPASTAAYVAVADDPNLLFEIQENSSPSALAAGAASRNADLNAGSGGSTYTGFSSWQLDSNTLNTSAKQLRIVQAVQSIDNAIGNYAKWLVMINQTQWRNTTGT
jgi:hypothetical protein